MAKERLLVIERSQDNLGYQTRRPWGKAYVDRVFAVHRNGGYDVCEMVPQGRPAGRNKGRRYQSYRRIGCVSGRLEVDGRLQQEISARALKIVDGNKEMIEDWAGVLE